MFDDDEDDDDDDDDDDDEDDDDEDDDGVYSIRSWSWTCCDPTPFAFAAAPFFARVHRGLLAAGGSSPARWLVPVGGRVFLAAIAMAHIDAPPSSALIASSSLAGTGASSTTAPP